MTNDEQPSPKTERIFKETEELVDKILDFLLTQDGGHCIHIAALTTAASIIAQGLEHDLSEESEVSELTFNA